MGLVVADITVENFGSYGPAQTLTLGGQGPVAITGENGAGKSTIVSKALTWCLYGKTAPERMGGGMKVLRGDSVIAKGESQVSSIVRFEDKDTGTIYRIQRTKIRGKTDELKIDRIDSAGTQEVDPSQEAIEGIVGASWEVWTRTVVRGQGDLWAFCEATDTKKREVLDAVSGGDTLNEAHSRAVVKRKEAASKTNDLQRRLIDCDRRLSDSKTRMSSLQTDHDRWESEREPELVSMRADVKAAENGVVDAKAADEEACSAREEAVDQKPIPEVDMEPYREAVGEGEKILREATRAFDEATSKVKSLSGLKVGEGCPTCGQKVCEDAPIIDQLTAAKEQAVAVSPAMQEAKQFYDDAISSRDGAEEWLSEEVERWRGEVSAAPMAKAERTPMAELALKAVKQRLEASERSDNPYKVALSEARLKNRTHVVEGVMVRNLLMASEKELEKAESWEEALHPRGARAAMASSALAAIEHGANEWLTVLSDNRMGVEFPEDTKREKIGTKVLMGGVARDLLTYSGGERRRVNMAVDLGVSSAFSKGGLSVSLLVLDEEVFSGMDEAGKSAVVHALHGAGVADVVVVDHDPRLSAVLPRTIEVVRGSNGFSEIKENRND
jgi:DNA repair exonuclease SbcCD ATPase subunit